MDENSLVKLIIGGVGLFVAVFILIVIFPVTIVGAGERGVIFNNTSGVQDRVLGEGMHFRIPLIESVKSLSVKVQATTPTLEAGSKDLQTITISTTANWHLDPAKVNKFYQEIGDDDKKVIDGLVTARVEENVKAVVANFTAEESIQRRPEIKLAAREKLAQELVRYHIVLDDLVINNINFSKDFNEAIERKATAVQNADAEKNKLEQIKYQAQQQVETAKGEAEATKVKAIAEAESIKIKSEALKGAPGLAELNAIEQWNGVLPVNMYGNTPIPFLNIN